MIPKAQGILAALKEGVRTVHIINGMKASTLLTEIFTDTGCGTMIF
jgi:acetylglutamate kinase